MKTKLTYKQSTELIDVGAPREKATGKGYFEGVAGYYSTFTLADLLEILPKEIMFDKEHGLDFGWDFYANKWYARYSDEDSLCVYENAWYIEDELIDALYQLACWYYKTKRKFIFSHNENKTY